MAISEEWCYYRYMSGAVKKHTTDIRVRYAETDRMGVVYYGNYFVWFEVARTEFFRAAGFSYRELEEKRGLRVMVVGASCRYRSPATYDDTLSVETWISGIKNTSLVFAYQVRRDSTLIATGETTHVFTDVNGKPIKIPGEISSALTSAF